MYQKIFWITFCQHGLELLSAKFCEDPMNSLVLGKKCFRQLKTAGQFTDGYEIEDTFCSS